jgi:hypothetical protein
MSKCGCHQCPACVGLCNKAIAAFTEFRDHLAKSKASSNSSGSTSGRHLGLGGTESKTHKSRGRRIDDADDMPGLVDVSWPEELVGASSPPLIAPTEGSPLAWDAKQGCPFCHYNGPTQCECMAAYAELQTKPATNISVSKSSTSDEAAKVVTAQVPQDQDKIKGIIDSFLKDSK